MADSNTTTYSFTLPEVGASADSWGTKLNANWDKVDDLLDGSIAVNGITVTGGSIDGTPVGATTPSTGAFTTVTTTGNVDVTGTVTADGLTVDGGSTVDAITYTNSSDFPTTGVSLNANGFSYEMVGSQGKIFRSAGNTKALMEINDNNDLHLYEDTGTTAKMVWDASAESLGIGTATPSRPLTVSTTNSIPAEFDHTDGSDVWLKLNNTTQNYYMGYVGTDFVLSPDTANRDLTIDSAGNVGIGTASPSKRLSMTLSSPYDDGISVHNGFNTWQYKYGVGGQSSQYHDITYNGVVMERNYGSSIRAFYTGGSERARIDSSGNLLVGKTTTNTDSVGFEARATGLNAMVRDGGEALVLGRKTNDGSILSFRKDGTTVGSIGTDSGNILKLNSGGNDKGVFLARNGANVVGFAPNEPDVFRPATLDTCDLGKSDRRFKDLYLSGGVYLGGTGAANKLDDYETGTWTPSFSGGTYGYAAQLGRYTKVGNKVTVSMALTLNSVSGTSGNLTITGLPFNNIIGEDGVTSLSFSIIRNLSADHKTVRGYINNNTTQITLTKNATNTGFGGLPASDLTANTSIYATLTYFTNA